MDISDNTFAHTMVKGSSGLGFSVLGGRDAHPDPKKCVVRIKRVFPTGSAAQSGMLFEGDVLLEMNGQKLKDLSCAVSILVHYPISPIDGDVSNICFDLLP